MRRTELTDFSFDKGAFKEVIIKARAKERRQSLVRTAFFLMHI